MNRRAVLAVLTVISLALSPAFASPRLTQTSPLLITALHYYGNEGTLDEAVRLTNVTTQAVALNSAWLLRDQANRSLAFPPLALGPGAHAWVVNNANAFVRQFGFSPTLSFAQMSGSVLGLGNDGGSVRLVYAPPGVLDTANANGGAWDAGSGSPSYRTMERIDSGLSDAASNWASANIVAPIAFDANGNPITGTPRALNSVAIAPTSGDLGVVLNEVAWGGTRANPNHEWIELHNNLAATVALTGWSLRVVGKAAYALAGEVAPHGFFVLQRDPNTFSSGVVADQTFAWSNLSNSGEALQLVNTTETVLDTLVYGDGAAQAGWSGAPLQPYVVTNSIGASEQLLMRRLGWPDTDTAQDWLNDRADVLRARRPIYPGWDYERFAAPVSAMSVVTVAAAPDASFDVLSATLATAHSSIDIEVYTFENALVAEILSAKAAAGVRVRVLLDGAPVGGVTDAEKWACQRIFQAGNTASGCWFMRADSGQNISKRYKSLHSKMFILDGQTLVVGSENLGPNGYPFDDKRDGTFGNRGALAVVKSPALIARAQEIFDADFGAAHLDIARWCDVCAPYGPPTLGFAPVFTTGGVTYTARFSTPLFVAAPVSMELATSPEANLRDGGLVALLRAAGPGDEVLAEQLDEPTHWGAAANTPETDPNVRLQELIGAAARGAKVRVLLDSYFDDDDDPRNNASTVAYVNALGAANGWDLRGQLGNPAGRGIHNKMYLARVGARKFAQIGSWNGSEVSAKRNRELTLLIESAAAFDYLRDVFYADWWLSQPTLLPIAVRVYTPVAPITHVLVSEIMINPAGADENAREWIELFNPSLNPIDLSRLKVGDAEAPGKYGDGMYQFPSGATLPPLGVAVVAVNGGAFFSDWGRHANFEIGDYDPLVPNMIQYSAWSTSTLSLGNSGDQVLVLDANDAVVDAAQWLTTTLTGTSPYTGVIASGHTLQRYPPELDTDDANADFRDQPVPSPGVVP